MDLKTALGYSEFLVYILSVVFVSSICVFVLFSRLAGLLMMTVSLALLPWAIVGLLIHSYVDPALFDQLDQLPELVSTLAALDDNINIIPSNLPNVPDSNQMSQVMAALKKSGAVD